MPARSAARSAPSARPSCLGEGHLTDRRCGGAVIDPDDRHARPLRPGVDDCRQTGGGDRVEDGVVLGRGPDDESVDGGVRDPRRIAVLAGGRHQRQPDRFGGAHLGHAGKKSRRLRVLEGVGQPLAEHETETPGSASAERASTGVWAGVPELGSGGSDPRDRVGRDTIWPRVGVGHGHHRHPGGLRHLVAGIGIGAMFPLTSALHVKASALSADGALGQVLAVAAPGQLAGPLIAGAIAQAAGLRVGLLILPLLTLLAAASLYRVPSR